MIGSTRIRALGIAAVLCMVASGCTLFTWGDNGNGQLGDGTTKPRSSPTSIDPTTQHDWSAISVGDWHTCGVRTDGTLWCWGRNSFGQLGLGDTTHRSLPTRVGTSSSWAGVAAGGAHTCAVSTSALLWCWGFNSSGQVGNNSTTTATTPTAVLSSVSDMALGSVHTCAIRSNDALWCWGNNSHGQLGVGDTTNRTTASIVDGALDWDHLALGERHSCAITSGNFLHCFGRNNWGQLGLGDTTNRLDPVQISPFAVWNDIGAGGSHTCATRLGSPSGTLWCWGQNSNGQLGLGDTTTRFVPTQVGTFGWSRLQLGYSFSCADRGPVHCWGAGSNGQLGNGTTASSTLTPTPVVAPHGLDVVGTGHRHACALETTEPKLWCWGHNFYGQVGDGTTADRAYPTPIEADFNDVSAGAAHTCRVRSDDTLWCWGDNAAGQLGDGTTTDRGSPTVVGTDRDWLLAAAGGESTCALRTDRSLWCWGASAATAPQLVSNGSYRSIDLSERSGNETVCGVEFSGVLSCGDWTSGMVQVGPFTSWRQVATGGGHQCGLDWSDNLWCWGDNGRGQIGDGTTTPRVEPVEVGAGTDWALISAGDESTCARSAGKELWCWGANEDGQLGLGDTVDRVTPTRVGTGTNWNGLSVADSHACATRLSGGNSLWCWGDNASGQIGDGTTVDRLVPTEVGTGESWVYLDTGAAHTAAIPL